MLAPARASPVALFCLNVQLCVRPERRKDFLKCIRNNQRCTRASEPLNVRYLFGEDTDVPNRFNFFESYIGKEGFTHHTETPHFAAWEAFAASDPFTAPPKVFFYNEDAPSRPGLAPVVEGHSPFSLNVRLSVKPEHRSAFLTALRADRDGALATEPRAFAYTFGEDCNSPNVFHMFEQYVDREAFVEHTKTPHYSAWAAFKETAQPFAEPTEVSYYMEDTGI